MKRILIAVALVGLLIALVLGLSPGLRSQLFGYSIAQHLKMGEDSELAFTLVLTRGQEILGRDGPSDTPPAQEQMQLNLRLAETVESTGRESTLQYAFREMRSEQLNADIRGILSKEHFSLRIPRRGTVLALARPTSTTRDVLSDADLAQFFCGIWPGLPDTRVTPGQAKWSATFELERTLLGETLRLKHRMDYQLLSIQEKGGKPYALIEFAGEIVPEKKQGGKADVSGTGRVYGKTLVDLQDGRAVVGSQLLGQDYFLKFPEGGATYRWYEHQDLKYWRGKMEQTLPGEPSPAPPH